MITRVNTAEALERAIASNAAVLVYFYHDHCAPCRQLRPKIEELTREHFPEMVLVYVNALESPVLAAGFHAFSWPVLLFFFDGKETRRYSKYVSVKELRDEIGRLYRLYFDQA